MRVLQNLLLGLSLLLAGCRAHGPLGPSRTPPADTLPSPRLAVDSGAVVRAEMWLGRPVTGRLLVPFRPESEEIVLCDLREAPCEPGDTAGVRRVPSDKVLEFSIRERQTCTGGWLGLYGGMLAGAVLAGEDSRSAWFALGMVSGAALGALLGSQVSGWTTIFPMHPHGCSGWPAEKPPGVPQPGAEAGPPSGVRDPRDAEALSRTSGFALGGGLAGAGLVSSGRHPDAHGTGVRLRAAFGATEHVSGFFNVDGTSMTSGRDADDAPFLTHGDLGVRVSPGSSRRRFRPYVEGAYTIRIQELRRGSESVDVQGAAWSVGGGFELFGSRKAALDTGLLLSLGRFTERRPHGAGWEDLGDAAFFATTVRLVAGMTWHP